ncbi:MAG: PAS domain-containing protein, partial [Acidimicrobiales bacterium]
MPDRRSTEESPVIGVDAAAVARLMESFGFAVVAFDSDRRIIWANQAARSLHVHTERSENLDLEELGAVLHLPEDVGEGPTTIRIVTDRALLERAATIATSDNGGFLIAFAPVDRSDIDTPSEGEQRLEALLQFTNDIITVLDADGTVQYSNPAAGQLTGFN